MKYGIKCIRWRICVKYGSIRLKRDKNEKLKSKKLKNPDGMFNKSIHLDFKQLLCGTLKICA
jgi:hypothetical protein